MTHTMTPMELLRARREQYRVNSYACRIDELLEALDAALVVAEPTMKLWLVECDGSYQIVRAPSVDAAKTMTGYTHWNIDVTELVADGPARSLWQHSDYVCPGPHG